MGLWVLFGISFDARSGMLVDSVEMTETKYDETRRLSYLDKRYAERILCWL
jgi:hypothetical protein